MIEFESESTSSCNVAKIKVIGVGGAGTNMVNAMIEAGFEGIEFIVANTDAQALKTAQAPHKIQIGVKSTKGLGAGASPDIGRKAAEEDIDKLMTVLQDADIVFLCGGLGGGTGSGALPVIAKKLREKDILSVATVTKPFTFEGKRRMDVAHQVLSQLEKDVDTLIVLPNQKLIDVIDPKVPLKEAFDLINSVLLQFVSAISDIITRPGHINVDFADIKTIMKQKGYAIIGTGKSSGSERAKNAARNAISAQLLESKQVEIDGAKGVLINITGSSNMSLFEVNEAATIIHEQAHPDATIILGWVIDEALKDHVAVTVIATGFAETDKQAQLQQFETAPAVKHETQATEPMSEAHQEKNAFDLNDLDVPAIMRRIAQEKQI